MYGSWRDATIGNGRLRPVREVSKRRFEQEVLHANQRIQVCFAVHQECAYHLGRSKQRVAADELLPRRRISGLLMHVDLQRIFTPRNAVTAIDRDHARLAKIQTIGQYESCIFTRNQRLDTQRACSGNLGKARARDVYISRQRVYIKDLPVRLINAERKAFAGQHRNDDRILSLCSTLMLRTLHTTKLYERNNTIAGIDIIVFAEVSGTTSEEEDQRKQQGCYRIVLHKVKYAYDNTRCKDRR